MPEIVRLIKNLRHLPGVIYSTTVREVRGPVVIGGRLPLPPGTVVKFGSEDRSTQAGSPHQPEIGQALEIRDESLGELIGFSSDSSFFVPYSGTIQLRPDTPILALPAAQEWQLDYSILGTVTDHRGRIIKRLGPPDERFAACPPAPLRLHNSPPPPLSRRPADKICKTGIRAIDAFVTLACGQRIAVLAEPGVGKSTLLSTIARNAQVDVTVVALIGERGREVSDFINSSLVPAIYGRTTVVQATSDVPGVCRINACLAAMSVAEYFRDQGLNVLLLVDSLTRLLRAYREVGLAAGEVPVRRGYPPSVYSALPKLIERSGCGERGSITTLLTVLASADLEQDPMLEEIKGLTDGHMCLSNELAEAGVFPAIDPLRSLSRLQRSLLSEEQLQLLLELRARLSRAERERELVALGGSIEPELARAFRTEAAVRKFIAQAIDEYSSFEETMSGLMQLCNTA